MYELELQGYEIKRGKYISLKAEGQQRFVRTKTLGENYTVDSLVSRILWRDAGSGVSLNDDVSAPLQEDYKRAIDNVIELARTGKKIQRRRDTSAPYSPDNDLDVYKLSAQLSIINRDNIHSIGELEGKIQRLKTIQQETNKKIADLKKAFEVCKEKYEIYKDIADTYREITQGDYISKIIKKERVSNINKTKIL